MFTKMVNMARSAKEAKAETAPMAIDAAEYPYGLCLSLDEAVLDKLGIKDMPDVGDMCHLMAMAKVTSVSQNERMNGDGSKTNCCRIELQITDLGIENENAEEEGEAPRRNAGKRYRARQEEED